MKKKEQGFRYHWDNIKRATIHVFGITKEKIPVQKKHLEETVVETFQKFAKGINLQIQETKQTPNRISANHVQVHHNLTAKNHK